MLSNPSSKEVARVHGAEEIVLLRQRVRLWRDDYIQSAPPRGGEDYLFLEHEFIQEVEEYIYPYVRRLRETDHLDQDQVNEFMDYCYQQIYALREYLLEGTAVNTEETSP